MIEKYFEKFICLTYLQACTHLTLTPTPKTPKLMGVFCLSIFNYLFGPNIPFCRVLNGVREYGFIFEKIQNPK